MKVVVGFALFCAAFLQVTEADGWVQKVEEAVREDLLNALTPTLVTAENLKRLIEETKRKQRDNTWMNKWGKRFYAAPTTYLQAGDGLGADSENCSDLSTTLEEGYNLTMNITNFAESCIESIGEELNNLLGCAVLNPIYGAKCFLEVVKKIRWSIIDVRPVIMEYETLVEQTFEKIKAETENCFDFI